MTTQPTFTQPGQGGPALSAVPTPAGIPDFEGTTVNGAVTKMTGTTTIASNEEIVLGMDDRIRLVGSFRVVGVGFKLDPKTGDVIREHLLKAIDIAPCPWDPNDPTDDGIVRARPRP